MFFIKFYDATTLPILRGDFMPIAANFPKAGIYPISPFPQRTPSASRSGMLKKNWPGAPKIPREFDSFHAALDFHMIKNGDDSLSLLKAISKSKFKVGPRALSSWRLGSHTPQGATSMKVLKSIERHYKLDSGYFAKLLATFRPTYKHDTRHCLNAFHSILNYQMRMHQDSSSSLAKAIRRSGELDRTGTLTHWKTGRSMPRRHSSYALLARIERRYRLPAGYFSELIAQPETARKRVLKNVRPSLRSIFCWHLPDDFENRSLSSQQEIVKWIYNNVMTSSTEFGRYQREATKYSFAVIFPRLSAKFAEHSSGRVAISQSIGTKRHEGSTIKAPRALTNEMENLISFRTSVLPPLGYNRTMRWGRCSAERAIRDFGLLFGALVAAPSSPAAGLGVPVADLSFGLLAFPGLWDWYLRWKEKRRGFFATTERSFLYGAKCVLRGRTGWVRQHPELVERIMPIKGIVSEADIFKARSDWSSACDRALEYVLDRIPELQRTVRIHRDPSEAIMPVLEAQSPMGQYKKIADEILRQMPDERQFPMDAARTVRSYLIIRFAMHLGVRQRNLRELLLCRRDKTPRTAAKLAEMRRGELRWNGTCNKWEIFIPAVAFKNGDSSFFKGKPFRLLLPDVDVLYPLIDSYIDKHRNMLLGSTTNLDTFFVSSATTSKSSRAYGLHTFYSAWVRIIQRYGIFNPYTGRGAIFGLLPHGPHVIRDIIATHILRRTGSYELAGFAIQDTAQAATRHYARFFPHEKSAQAAQILDEIWRISQRGLQVVQIPPQRNITLSIAAIPNKQVAMLTLTLTSIFICLIDL